MTTRAPAVLKILSSSTLPHLRYFARDGCEREKMWKTSYVTCTWHQPFATYALEDTDEKDECDLEIEKK